MQKGARGKGFAPERLGAENWNARKLQLVGMVMMTTINNDGFLPTQE